MAAQAADAAWSENAIRVRSLQQWGAYDFVASSFRWVRDDEWAKRLRVPADARRFPRPRRHRMIATAPRDTIAIRLAKPGDTARLERLIADSARALGKGFYSATETEAAITHVFGVDSELVADGTYLVVEHGENVLACGGWSRRETLFGGDRHAQRSSVLLDPARDAARIRAFFVAPGQARRGVGSRLLAACEEAARDAGFTRAALMATLPGVPFYARHGYRAEPGRRFDLGGTPVAFVPMDKSLLHI